MRVWDLHSPSSRLRQALKDLRAADARIADEWQDEKAREFSDAFIEPLDPQIRTLLMAIAELDEILAKAEKICGTE